jgi:hypothetical protein
MNTAHDDEVSAENRARQTLEAEMEHNARLRKIIGLSEIDTEQDSEEVVDAKLLERAGALTMIAALVSTPLTGAAEVERRAKLRALRADGWIPEEEEDGSSPGERCAAFAAVAIAWHICVVALAVIVAIAWHVFWPASLDAMCAAAAVGIVVIVAAAAVVVADVAVILANTPQKDAYTDTLDATNAALDAAIKTLITKYTPAAAPAAFVAAAVRCIDVMYAAAMASAVVAVIVAIMWHLLWPDFVPRKKS